MSAARRVPQRWFANVADPMRRFHPIADIFPLLEGDEFDSARREHPDEGRAKERRNAGEKKGDEHESKMSAAEVDHEA